MFDQLTNMETPTDVMAYLGGSNNSLYSHLTQVRITCMYLLSVLQYTSPFCFVTLWSLQSWLSVFPTFLGPVGTDEMACQVLATMAVQTPTASESDLFKLSRTAAENTLRWDVVQPRIKADVSALIESRDLFKVRMFPCA